MVSDSCGHGNSWLLIGRAGRFSGHYLYLARSLYYLVQRNDSEFTRSNDLRCHLLCYLVQFRRNHPRRNLGRSILGAVLGLGPEGERSASYRFVERDHSSRPLGWLHSRTWTCSDECFWQHRGQSVLVRSEHAGRRSALLWLYGSGVRYSDDVHRYPTGHHGSGDAFPEILARHPGAGETSFRGPASGVTCAECSGEAKIDGTTPIWLIRRDRGKGRMDEGTCRRDPTH